MKYEKKTRKNSKLTLCDRLNMDLDRESLELMLNLLDTDSRIKDALDGAGMNKRELEKNKQKVGMSIFLILTRFFLTSVKSGKLRKAHCSPPLVDGDNLMFFYLSLGAISSHE